MKDVSKELDFDKELEELKKMLEAYKHATIKCAGAIEW